MRNSEQRGVFDGYGFDAEPGVIQRVIHQAVGSNEDDGLDAGDILPKLLQDLGELCLYRILHRFNAGPAGSALLRWG